ncbi:MAG: cysteine desulfurase family protein [Christensenellales bacterium]
MIYLDNASTTKIFASVNKKIFDINNEYYFNPSALYKPAIDVLQMLNDAKTSLAKNMGTTSEHIVFTSGATEGNNTAINGFLTGKKDAEYIFTSGEHPSVYAVANNLKNSKTVKFVPLNKDGSVDEQKLKDMLSPNTHFVSIIHVSNETGAINDIQKLCKIIKEYNPNIIVHSDGTQAFGKIPVHVTELGVDCYTISAHKFHGPKGVGALYVKDPKKLKPYVLGGGQQQGYRSGTENVSGFVGMSLASDIAINNLQENYAKINALRDYVKQQIAENCTDFCFNESKQNSPYILSVSFKGLRGEVLLHMLEEQGVIIGIGSACSSKKQNNRVLEQMGVDKQYILGSIRISLSSFNTPQEIKQATKIIIEQYKILKEKMR